MTKKDVLDRAIEILIKRILEEEANKKDKENKLI